MAGETVYTLGRWMVKEGQETAFVNAWKDLGAFFYSRAAAGDRYIGSKRERSSTFLLIWTMAQRRSCLGHACPSADARRDRKGCGPMR